MRTLTGVGLLLSSALAITSLPATVLGTGQAAGASMVSSRRPSTFTWSAEYPDGAAARSRVIVTAAVVDSSDAVILAGVADGPLDLGGECKIAYGGSKHPFLAEVTPEGHLAWCRMLGPVAALFRSGVRTFAVGSLGKGEFPAIASVSQ